MDISGITSLASSTAAMTTGDAVGVAVLKKAMNIEAAGAAALIQALPPAPSANLPAHVGRSIDTIA